MDKAQLISKFTSLLADYSNNLPSAQIGTEKDLYAFIEDILTQLQEARSRIPHKSSKIWDVEREFSIELKLKAKADLNKGNPGSHYEPYEPVSIEDIELEIEGCPITYKLWATLMENYEEEIEEQIWDAAEEQAEENR